MGISINFQTALGLEKKLDLLQAPSETEDVEEWHAALTRRWLSTLAIHEKLQIKQFPSSNRASQDEGISLMEDSRSLV